MNKNKARDEAAGHRTRYGRYLVGDVRDILESRVLQSCKGKVQLILTSPPFPLNRKKRYGNFAGPVFRAWFASLAPLFAEYLSEDGSIVIEMGNSWEQGRPVQSLLHLEALMDFVRHHEAGLKLCQQFICYNPSRLPSPAQWVTVNPIRAVDSFTHVWWMSKSEFPKADSRKVLRPYSKEMRSLIKRGTYNAGARPSEHTISSSGFSKDRGGSIPHNLVELEPMDPNRQPRPPNALSFANTSSNDWYARNCRSRGIRPHPARMPPELAAFFVEFLTDPGDLVLDPFAGSNTTGYVAEKLGRKWRSLDANNEYVEQSILRFKDPEMRGSGK
jgi:hypothetical protein